MPTFGSSRSMSMGGNRSGSMYGGVGNVKISSSSSSMSYRSGGGGGGGGGMGGNRITSGFGFIGGGGAAGQACDWAAIAAGGGGGAGFGGGSGGGGGGCIDISASEKATMQNLNDRLASYLEKVRQLEEANAELERKIREFVQAKVSGGVAMAGSRDWSGYYDIIADLQLQIQEAAKINGAIYLSIDNAKLAADDFRIKWENELAMRQSVEADIAGLRRVLDELTMGRSDLEMSIEGLKEELIFLKKNHEEDMATMSADASASIDVQLDAIQGNSLADMLEQIRDQYEADAAKEKKKMAAWFEQKSAAIVQDMAGEMEVAQSTKTEITDLKRSLQALEIELQSQLSMKGSLENTLADTNGRYGMKIAGYQNQVIQMEEQLSQMRYSLEEQSREYEILLDIKARLEMEIAEYRRLLDGQGGAASGSGSGGFNMSGGMSGGMGGGGRMSSTSVSKSSSSYSSSSGGGAFASGGAGGAGSGSGSGSGSLFAGGAAGLSLSASGSTGGGSSGGSSKTTKQKTITIVEELVNGKVVSSTSSEVVSNIS